MEPSEAVPAVKLPEKVWNKYCPEYTLPKPDDGDIWANCLKPLLDEDKQQCDAWRDEVQNLLLFAGLFSAVVTTFVVDSYKNLLPSPDQRTVELLSQILTRLDNSSTNFDPTPSLSLGSPSPSSIRINTLWFMSLVISLTTVLVGIVSLQWIREYERYSGRWTPKEIFEVRNMRHESMNEWFVPQIFTGLPVLLQAALVLFFVGLMDFLLHLYPCAAIPAIIVIITTLCFIVLTTVLPTLQWYTTYKFRHVEMPTLPSPYKSPQSWVILSATELIGKFLLLSKIWAADQIRTFLYGPQEPRWRISVLSDWSVYDRRWVNKRSQQVQVGSSSGQSHHYDTAHGVAHVITKYCRSNKALALSAYHCFLEQHKSSWGGVHHWHHRHRSHFYKCLGPFHLEGPIPFFHGDFNQLPHPESLRQDESLMIFLSSSVKYVFYGCGMEAMITRQKMELLIRMSTHFGDSNFLDSCLASEAQQLYGQLVDATIDATGDSVLWQPVAARIAEVTAKMGLCSTPSILESMNPIQYAHADLAKNILESGTDRYPSSSGLSHKLGYAFVEHIFHGQSGQISLPEWPEEYMESFIFLTHAIHKTMDGYPETNHSPVITSRMREFLSEISPELRGRVSKRYPIFPKEPDNTSPPEKPPTEESVL